MAILAPETETKLISGDELWQMGDIGPCELIDGRIVMMSPTGGEHGSLETNLTIELGLFVRQKKLGYIATGEVGIYIQHKPDRIRAADIAFLSHQQLPNGLPKGYLDTAPELVVEVISPNDLWSDIRAKLRDYFSIGVARVWLVEPEGRTILIYRSATEFEERGESDILRGEGTLDGFELPVVQLFAAGA